MRRAAQQALQTFTNFVDSDFGSDNEESDSELLNNLSQLEENNDSKYNFTIPKKAKTVILTVT